MSDVNFYDRRAEQERTMAQRAGTPGARIIHLDLAERYARLSAQAVRPKLSIAVGR